MTPQVDKARAASAGMLAFYIGRMGTFYAAQLTRLGYGEAVETVKKAWAGGSRAAAEAVPDQLVDATGCVGSVEAGINRLQAQAECGVDLHHVNVQAENNTEYERILEVGRVMWRGDLGDRPQLFLVPSCGGVAEGRGGFAQGLCFVTPGPVQKNRLG